MATKQKILGVIPARLNSTRLPGKMLIDIEGMPLIVRTYRQALQAKLLDAVVVATDSPEIREAVVAYGGRVIMTSKKPKTGSDRVAEAAKKFTDFKPSIVLNIQGDEPLMPPTAIDLTARLLLDDSKAPMSTVATPFTLGQDVDEPGLVKVVTDKEGYALYFSRSRLPYPRATTTHTYLNHLGIYGYRFGMLQKFVTLRQTPLEKIELLEQLRALENGYRIKVGIGNFKRAEVNEPHELERAREMVRRLKL